MIHAKLVQPRVFPWNNDITPGQIDRAQDIGGDLTLEQTKLYEIGRDGNVGVNKETPTLSYTMRQFEYGSMDFWRKLANHEEPGSGEDHDVTLDDLKSTRCDITAYLTDDDSTFTGTIWFPNLRVNGFSLNIADPESAVERNFDLVGEDFKILDENYFAYETATVVSPGDGTVTLDPVPVEWASGDYVFRVLRVRSNQVTNLEEDAGGADNTWSYNNGTHVVTVKTCLAGDILKVYYPSATAYATLWTDNDSDAAALYADSCDIYMKVNSSQKIYRLQSVGIDVSFERADYREIGNTDVVQTGVQTQTVTVTLNRYGEDFTLEDILASDTSYPYINPRDFSDGVQLMVKIYEDNTKASFKMGYLIERLSPTGINTSQAVEDYNQMGDTLEADNLKISDLESEIAFA